MLLHPVCYEFFFRRPRIYEDGAPGGFAKGAIEWLGVDHAFKNFRKCAADLAAGVLWKSEFFAEDRNCAVPPPQCSLCGASNRKM